MVIGVLTPFAVFSLAQEVSTKSLSQAAHWLTPTEAEQGEADSYSRVHVDLVHADEVRHELTLRVSGNHICTYVEPGLARFQCRNQDVLTFYSVPDGLRRQEGIPPQARFELPADGSAVERELKLKFTGNPMSYPFDQYHLRLGILMERIFPDDRVVPLTEAEARGHLFVTMDEQMPRVKVLPPLRLDPMTLRPQRSNLQYTYGAEVRFERPIYLKVLVVLLLLLITATAAFAVLLRPFRELLLNAGTSVLGVWGVRALLLGNNFPSDVTVVDALLTSVVLFLLGVIAVRAFDYLHDRAGLNLFPWLPWDA